METLATHELATLADLESFFEPKELRAMSSDELVIVAENLGLKLTPLQLQIKDVVVTEISVRQLSIIDIKYYGGDGWHGEE
jgi:hypothetical protein